MNKSGSNAFLLVVVVALSLPAYAQQGESAPVQVATLHLDKGVVMTSTGGEFVSSGTGQQLNTGERLMVTKDSSATVVYSNHCRRTYDTPGVYTIEADCKAAVALGGAGTTAAIVVGAVAAGVFVNNINDSGNNSQPISR
ncbi:MAG: hypothetical protein ACYDC8_16740 [Gammaproteobacteria bacterium]